MTNRSLTIAFTTSKNPAAVFDAVKSVKRWWSEDIEGVTDQVGSIFHYRFRDVHRCTVKVTELVSGSKVAWHVLDNYFSFTKSRSEWVGTDVIFDIAKKGDKTEVRFTHRGLTPEDECYDACSEGWGTYVRSSLRDLIETGKGQPNVGEPMTDTERTLTG